MANEYLKRTPTSSGNRKVFTFSVWYKRLSDNGATTSRYFFLAGDTHINLRGSGATNPDDFITNQRGQGTNYFYHYAPARRDYSSWQHLLYAVDTTQSIEKNRGRVYINGVEQLESSSIGSSNAPLDDELSINKTVAHFISEDGGDDGTYPSSLQLFDAFLVDGQALTPDVFGFYKDGDGYMSSGTTNATDFRPGQWSPRLPKSIKYTINRRGGFGVNGFYLPMNDSSNPGADFHCDPNSIITLKGEDLPQPRNGAPTTTDLFVSQLRTDPFAANLVLAVPGASTATGATLVTNGTFDNGTTGWTAQDATLSVDNGKLSVYTLNTSYGSALQTVTGLTIGQRYTFQVNMYYVDGALITALSGAVSINSGWQGSDYVWRTSFTATTTSLTIDFQMGSITNITGLWDNVILKQEDAPTDYSADIKGSGSNKTLTADGSAGIGYELGGYYGSAMTFDGTGDYFTVPNTADLRMGSDDFTIEAWVNKNDTGSGAIFALYDNGNDRRSYLLYSDASNDLTAIVSTSGDSGGNTMLGGSTSTNLGTNQWNHCVMEREGSYFRLYLNGVVADIATDLSGSLYENTTDTPAIGTWFNSGVPTGDTDGQIQDLRVYKGVAKYKGGFDVPKPYTPVGIESWRTTADTCKNNFATWNPLLGPQTCALADGNLTVTSSGGNRGTRSTIGVTSGKWYWEYRVGSVVVNSYVGVSNRMGADGLSGGSDYMFHGTSGNNYADPSGSFSVTNAAFTTGMIIGFAFDYDAGTLNIYKDGTLAIQVTGGSFGGLSYHAHISFNAAVSDGWEGNFGQNPSFSGTTTAGTNADDNGKGLFKYAPPTGFLALCEDNLPTPAIADPGKHFKCVLWTGSGGSKAITGVGFKPDLVWVKSRTNTEGHILFDSVRGPNVRQLVHINTTEGTAVGGVNSFDDDGFSVGQYTGTNQSGQDYVAWCWKAGGAAVSNTDGTITSQVSVNQTAGFSVGTFSGNLQANQSIGHGLGKVPSMVVVKERNANSGWAVYHKARGNTKVSYWDLPNTEFTETGNGASWGPTDPTSDVFYVGANGATNDNNLAFYAWAEIEGFSKFGSYIGNNDADGPAIFCGFKPAFLMIKLVTGSERDWHIYDSSRNPTNPVGLNLRPSTTAGDINEPGIDFLSNGFKIRQNYAFSNENTQTIIFAAFAESPFQTSNAK